MTCAMPGRPDDVALACTAHPDDCVNGPEPHEFVPDDGTETVLPCCRQPWEAE